MNKKQPVQAKEKSRNFLKPGDIWRHKSMGLLYVTDEEVNRYPGHYKCYWSMGGNPNAPWTFLKPNNPIVNQMILLSEGTAKSTPDEASQ